MACHATKGNGMFIEITECTLTVMEKRPPPQCLNKEVGVSKDFASLVSFVLQ